MLDDDYLKHLLLHHHIGNIQRLPQQPLWILFVFTTISSNSYSPMIMSFSSLVTYLVTRSFNLPVLHLVQLLYNLTLTTSNGFPSALMNTFVSPTGNNQQPTLTASDLTLNSIPDHVLVHLGQLPYHLVLHLVHLLVPDLLNNINPEVSEYCFLDRIWIRIIFGIRFWTEYEYE